MKTFSFLHDKISSSSWKSRSLRVVCMFPYFAAWWSGGQRAVLWTEFVPSKTQPEPPHCSSCWSSCCPAPPGSVHTDTQLGTHHTTDSMLYSSWSYLLPVVITDVNMLHTLHSTRLSENITYIISFLGLKEKSCFWRAPSAAVAFSPFWPSSSSWSGMRRKNVQLQSSSNWPCSGGWEHPGQEACSTQSWLPLCSQDQSSYLLLSAQWEQEDWRDLGGTCWMLLISVCMQKQWPLVHWHVLRF